MRLGERCVERKRRASLPLRSLHTLANRDAPIIELQRVGICQSRVCEGVRRIEREGTVKVLDRHRQPLAAPSVPVKSSLEIETVGLDVLAGRRCDLHISDSTTVGRILFQQPLIGTEPPLQTLTVIKPVNADEQLTAYQAFNQARDLFVGCRVGGQNADLGANPRLRPALERINREIGTTTVVITHNAVVAGMADRVLHLSDGVIAKVETNDTKTSPQDMHW